MSVQIFRNQWFLLVIFGCLSAFDVVYTGFSVYVMKAQEINPMYNWITDVPTMLTFISLVKATFFGLLCLLVSYMNKRSLERLATILLGAVAITTILMAVGVVVANIYYIEAMGLILFVVITTVIMVFGTISVIYYDRMRTHSQVTPVSKNRDDYLIASQEGDDMNGYSCYHEATVQTKTKQETNTPSEE